MLLQSEHILAVTSLMTKYRADENAPGSDHFELELGTADPDIGDRYSEELIDLVDACIRHDPP